MSSQVLLTGVSGYIGLHCAAELLRAGYRVRGSVRSLAKEQEVRATMEAAGVDASGLSFVTLDLTKDAGWDEAAIDCDYIMHVASPFVIANPKNEDELIVPAVQGTLRAMRAAKLAGVKRVVLTSSILSMMGHMKKGTFDQGSWTDLDAPDLSVYTKSKVMAEKAAWDYVSALDESDKFELTVVNPGGVFGPPLGNNITGQTMQMLVQMLGGKMPAVPDASFPMVDVRDVAEVHLAAMTSPEAAGQRFIAASEEPIGFRKIAQVLIDEGYKGPSTRRAPDGLIRFLALFDREARGMKGFLGMELYANTSATRDTFGWSPRSMEESVLEAAAMLKKRPN